MPDRKLLPAAAAVGTRGGPVVTSAADDRAVSAPRKLRVLLMLAASSAAFWLIFQLALRFLYADLPPLACRWDCWWYATIVERGYDLAAWPFGLANWAFFPAFPVLSLPLAKGLNLSADLAALVTAALCYGVAALVWRAYLLEVAGAGAARLGVFLFLFSGYAVYGHAGYAEPLYFLLMVLTFWSVRARRWILAGSVAAILSATRPTGVLIVLVFLVAGVRYRIHRCQRREQMAFAAGLALAPLGLLAFALHLHLHVGDALAFVKVQGAWNRRLRNPVTLLWEGLGSPPPNSVWSAAAVTGLLVAVYLMLRRYYEESVSLLANILVPLSTGLASLPRHVAWQMPFLFGLTLFCVRYRLAAWPVIVISLVLFVVMAIAWASGALFVV